MLSQSPFFYGYQLFDEPFMLLSNAFLRYSEGDTELIFLKIRLKYSLSVKPTICVFEKLSNLTQQAGFQPFEYEG